MEVVSRTCLTLRNIYYVPLWLAEVVGLKGVFDGGKGNAIFIDVQKRSEAAVGDGVRRVIVRLI